MAGTAVEHTYYAKKDGASRRTSNKKEYNRIEVNNRAGLELPSLRRACPSFQNLTLCAIVPLNGRIHEKRPGEVGGGPPFGQPVRAEHFIHYPVHILLFFYLRTGCIRVFVQLERHFSFSPL